jgi:hypothetical protein
MSDTKLTDKISEAITSIIKKTIIFEKSEKMKGIFIGIAFCSSILSIFTIYNSYITINIQNKVNKLDEKLNKLDEKLNKLDELLINNVEKNNLFALELCNNIKEIKEIKGYISEIIEISKIIEISEISSTTSSITEDENIEWYNNK